MLVFEFKAYGKSNQFSAVDEAIRTTQFIRNKAIRLWMDGGAKSCYDLNKHCAVLAKEFPFANQLNSMARQAAAERAWASIQRFYDNCKAKVSGKKADALRTRTHVGQCGCVLDRDHNAALNILTKAIGTTGHVGTSIRLKVVNASGDSSSTFVGANLREQDKSLREESLPSAQAG